MSKVTTQFNNYLGKRQRAIVLISPKLQVRDALVFHFPAEASLTRHSVRWKSLHARPAHLTGRPAQTRDERHGRLTTAVSF